MCVCFRVCICAGMCVHVCAHVCVHVYASLMSLKAGMDELGVAC